MAKDPATLWYWNDWIGGTMTMTRQAKGAYMDILTAQFNSGHLSETQIKTLLGQDQGLWVTVLREKFSVDADGRYYNKRLDDEIQKRRAFSLKQSNNGKKGGRKKGLANPTLKPKQSLLENEIEIEDEIENKDGGVGEEITLPKDGFFSDQLDKKIILTEMEIGMTIQFIRLTAKKLLQEKDVLDQWEAFKINQFEKHEWYNSRHDLLSHFRNSLKIQILNDGNKNRTLKQDHTHRAIITGTAESAGTL